MSRAVMQQALDALEKGETKLRWAAIAALKQALAEPEQEPDGISWLKRDSGYFTAPTPQHDTDCHLQGICQRSGYSIANTPRRPLTDEEIVTIWRQHNEQYNPHLIDGLLFARAIERAHGIGEQHGS